MKVVQPSQPILAGIQQDAVVKYSKQGGTMALVPKGTGVNITAGAQKHQLDSRS
jgi:hypothetical protein